MIDLEVAANPPAADGRNIDPALGTLRGEGALQKVEQLGEERPYERRPRRADSTADEHSYYGMPVLKESVWKWPVAAYFYTGGLAGASAALAAAGLLSGRKRAPTCRRSSALQPPPAPPPLSSRCR